MLSAGPACLAYIHKATEIDSSFVLKRWDASGHSRITLTFTFLTVKGEVNYF